MISIIKSKCGMTLMEVLVGGILFALVAATATAVLAPMMLAQSRANDFAEFNTLLDNLGNKIISDISQAEDVNFSGGTGDVNGILSLTINSEEIIYIINTDGILERNGVFVFHPDFYRGKTISFIVHTDTEPNYIVEVTVHPSGGGIGTTAAEITRSYAVRPLLMVQALGQ